MICGAEMAEIELTEREELVAQRAADLAVQKMTQEFYAGIGKSVINRWLIIIGAVVVAFATGKGWVPWR